MRALNVRLISLAKFMAKWGIAALGIGWLLAHMSLSDRVLLLASNNKLVERPLAGIADEADARFRLASRGNQPQMWVERRDLWVREDGRQVTLSQGAVSQTCRVLGFQPATGRLLLEKAHLDERLIASDSQIVGGFRVDADLPLIEIGIAHLLKLAKPSLLIAAILVFPAGFPFFVKRWQALLNAVEIRLGFGRLFALGMVGGFYNTFMPGSTGGDVVKAYYASRQTQQPVRAVISVVADRVLGLIALILLGGTMAWTQWDIPSSRYIAVVSTLLLIAGAVSCGVLFQPALRRTMAMDMLLSRLPFQHRVQQLVETVDLYRLQPGVLVQGLLLSVPIHACQILSTTLAGLAFGIKLPLGYYWVFTPVIALAGAIPISPHGAGIMEVLAVQLTRSQGLTVSQAVALAMATRLIGMFWGLAGVVFVVSGAYRDPGRAAVPHETQNHLQCAS